MTHCIRCHRPLTHPTESGMGPKCEKVAPPPPEYERDLFGYDIDRAIEVAQQRVQAVILSLTITAHIETRRAFVAARKRLGIWR